ncbi:MAG: archaetidylserine decarboxylase [Rhodospirillales bacterium]
MTVRALVSRVFLQEDLNFLLSNRIPRHLATASWDGSAKSSIPGCAIRRSRCGGVSPISTWRKLKRPGFPVCTTALPRKLKPGARPADPDPSVLTSPCDAIVGAAGKIAGTELIQAKGFPYTLLDLLQDPQLVETYRDGCYVTLRITSSMYHRFHAPQDCRVEQVTYISGDTWNVNPIALRRVEKLFCKNERAVIRTRLQGSAAQPGALVTLVPVAAILVASIRLHCVDVLLHQDYRGAKMLASSARYDKGEEMGWFQHGSTIIVFAPAGFALCDGVRTGDVIRAGQALLRAPPA